MSRFAATLAVGLLANLATAQLSCTVTSCGTSCGPTLTVTYAPFGSGGNYRIDMEAAGLHPNAFTVMQWGDGPQTIQLPGGCLYLINPIWGTFHTTDASGGFHWGRSWPHWAIATFHMQVGSLDVLPSGALDVRTTECQIGSCW